MQLGAYVSNEKAKAAEVKQPAQWSSNKQTKKSSTEIRIREF